MRNTKINIEITYNGVTPLGIGDTYCYKQDRKLYINLALYVTKADVTNNKGVYLPIAQLHDVAPQKAVWLPIAITSQPDSENDGPVEFGVIKITPTGQIQSYIPKSVTTLVNCFHINAAIDIRG